MTGVVAFNSGLVAVGMDWGDLSDGAVWRSDDGHAWSRVSDDNLVLGGPGNQVIYGVAVGGPGLVAVGADDSAGEYDFDAAVWTSTDGTEWTRVPHVEAIFGGPEWQGMWAVASAPSGLVAVGYERMHWFAAIWHSADGLTWSRVAADEALFGSPAYPEIRAIVATDSGFVAVGSVSPSGGSPGPAVWVSLDGAVWTRVPADGIAQAGATGGREMYAVSWSDGVLVAVGRDTTSGMAVVWRSGDDGWTWTRVRDADFGGPGTFDLAYAEMHSVAHYEGGVLAGGLVVGQSWDAAVWTSPDGVTWARVAADDTVFGEAGDQYVSSVTAFEGGLVAVGYDGSTGDADAAVWVWSVGSPQG
jgi:hypothetical protein